jgi:hypothetical protein
VHCATTSIVLLITLLKLHSASTQTSALLVELLQACLIAADWRAEFEKDVVVDIVGYRR